ncbi:MAG: hypothetical protein WKG06_05175 [Segetibacter sp.]
MRQIIILLIAAFSTFATYAQTGKSKSSPAKIKDTIQAKYTCSMDTDVVSNKPVQMPKMRDGIN